tara:strand:- start:1177 stop:1617 length:441 start_codon:yes stop_codon:yes gene_type:complete
MITKFLFFIFLQSLIFTNENDIIDVFEDYNNSFANKDYKNIVKHFDLPVSFNLKDKTVSASSNFKLKFIYRKIRGDLPEFYSHSVWDELKIKIVDEDIAIVNAKFSRYKNDGTIFYSGSGIYSLRKINGKWKFFSMLPYKKIEKVN